MSSSSPTARFISPIPARARSFPSNGNWRFRRRRRSSHDLGAIALLLDDMIFPNGLAFSPDQGRSISTISGAAIARLRSAPTARAPNRPIGCLRTSPVLSRAPDRLKIDTAGNVYCDGAGGIYMLDPQRKARLPRPGAAGNDHIGFGGDDLKTLFFTSLTPLGSVDIKIAGIPAPPRKKRGRGEDA